MNDLFPVRSKKRIPVPSNLKSYISGIRYQRVNTMNTFPARMLSVFIFLVFSVFSQTYTTNFDIGENPIFEGGKWTHTDATQDAYDGDGNIARNWLYPEKSRRR
jgi:hypothetical protein